MNETIVWKGLGEVQKIDGEHVITKKGVLDKDKFYLP